MSFGRLGLIGGRDNKRTSGIYSLNDHIARENSKTYLTSFTYDGKFNALTQAGSAQGFTFSPEGEILVVCTPGTRTTAKITSWSLSTPFDITTAVYDTGSDILCGDYEPNVNSICFLREIYTDSFQTINYDYLLFGGTTNDTLWSAKRQSPSSGLGVDVGKIYLGTQDASPRSTRFSSDGYTMFALGGSNRNVYQYTLPFPYSISNGSYANKTLAVTQDTTPQHIFFATSGLNTGKKMYMLGSTSKAIFSYTLGTAWDVSTGVSDYSAPLTFQTSTQATAPRSVYIGDNGTKMYVLSYVLGSSTIYQYTLNTPYDPSTAVYSPAKSLNINAGDTEPWEVIFRNDSSTQSGKKMYILGNTGDAVYSYTLGTAWDISTGVADYTPRSFNVTTQAAEPYNTYIGDSGTKMYVLNQATNAVFQYTLSTPYNVTTAVYASKTVSVATQETNARGMFFRDNGAKMYIIGVTNNAVFSYTLSTPWDVSTAVADFLVKSYLVSTQTANPIDFYVGDNGTKLYVLSGGAATTDTVFQYTLSTAWDVTSASYSNKSFSVNTQSSSSEGIFFKLDGTKMYVLNNGGTNADIIYQYTLSSAWDVSTASYDNVSFNVSSQESAPAGLYISPNGSKMYVGGQTGDDINEYDLITPWNVGSAVFVRASAVIGDATQGGIYFKSDGTRMYLIGGTNSNIFEYSLSIAWDVSTLSLTRTLPYNAAFFSGTPTGIFLKDDGAKVYVSNYTSNRVTELSLSVPWQITSVVGRYSAAAEDTACNSLYISPDGLRMYITGQTGDDVNQYDLSVAWDVSSATFVRVSATHGEGTATGLFFKSDGARMYVIGTTLDTIREFTLSTPWDVSTMVLDRQRYVSNFDTAPTGIHISPDGLQMYITGATNNTVYQFTLSQAWRSTYIAGYVTVQPEETGPLGMYISPDGFNLYVTGNTGDDVNQYLLDVAWDIGSAHYVRVSAYIGDTEPRGVYFSSDGTKMIVTGQTGDEFRQFSLSTPWNVSTAVLYDIFYYGHLYASVTCVHFSPDGLYMYWINGTIVYRFTLAQAFESNKVIGTYCVSKEETAPTAMHFNSTGTKLYVTGQTGDDVNEYTLSTPWDITTITYDRVSIGHGEATVTGLTIDETNGYLYICGSTLDTIRRFTISGGDVSTLTFVDSASIGFEPTSSGLLIADDYFILTGTTNDCAYSIDRPSVIFGGAFFEDGAFYANGASGYAYIGGSEANVRSLSVPSASWRTTPSENWGGILFTGGTAIRKYISSNTPYLESIALSQTLAITEPYGVSVNSKGTRIYVTLGTTTADKTGRSIRLVTMTTPFDLSTATLDSVEVIGAPGLLGNPANLWNIYVTPDEMRMFVMSPTVQGIYQFSRRFL